ncbi:MAG: hypothetical protein ABI923_06395 [bacterium]
MRHHFKRNLLSILGLIVFLFLALGSFPNTNNKNQPAGPVRHAADTTSYTNSRSDFTGKLADNYVDFSFDYPSSWKRKDSGKADSPNFVKVENGTSDNFTIENFAVGYFTGQRELMPKLADQVSEQFSHSFPEYKKVSQGETKVGPYDGYEFRFTARVANSSKGDVDIWGRCILLAGDTGRKGAALIMLASSIGNEVKGPDDVGEKGELPTILNSFKFGD